VPYVAQGHRASGQETLIDCGPVTRAQPMSEVVLDM
jgi:hypothetical protein